MPAHLLVRSSPAVHQWAIVSAGLAGIGIAASPEPASAMSGG
jgi:hypothetical protein